MPYFLEGEVRNPIGLENEYAMILAEQGVIGLLFWMGFILWFFSRAPIAFAKGRWDSSRRIGWCVAAAGVASAWIGIGMLSSIPATVLLLLMMGWTATPQVVEPLSAPGQSIIRRSRYRPVTVPSIP
jgi:O-antigen ligase